ncbi:hypothetical protein HYV22_03155 [Candidatus Gottesmanbacteria bacterium]|nr:hypothetical protein [Candidatus Gottesmanbacteria bacterium]
MASILPNGISRGRYSIIHKTLTEEFVRAEKSRAIWSHSGWLVRDLEAGTYASLVENNRYGGELWMSDTWMERFTNASFLQMASGHVVVAGLGIGMLPIALCQKNEVLSVTVIELEPDIIQLVKPYIEPHCRGKLQIICGDAVVPPFQIIRKSKLFDCAYLDIWPTICSDNWEMMKSMLRTYRKLAGHIDAWMREYVQEEARRDRRM